jgi:1-hydroxycarotenoid 3,4-desaturase
MFYRQINCCSMIFLGSSEMSNERVVIIGAGIGGLVAAMLLAARGIEVVLIERSRGPGGKMRQIDIGGRPVDAGPTVFTMRGVFDEIFAAAGASLSDLVTLLPATLLARHAWSATERLDLFSDPDRTANAIGEFAGAREAAGYRAFCVRARGIFEALEQPFICSQRPSLATLVASFGINGLGDLFRISPFVTLWSALGEYFRDPRLRQLFGRYATYCGSSPFQAPATLMLVAHVESEGVWLLGGGMHQLAQALAKVAARCGATLRYSSGARRINVQGGRASGITLDNGERIEAGAIIVNADPAAIGEGLFGESAGDATPKVERAARSLSAVTWTTMAPASGFPLARHNVFFSRNYRDEFDRIRRGKLPREPTVYVCAQDRTDNGQGATATPGRPEALLCLVNAPPNGDENDLESAEIDQCEERTFSLLEHHGLRIGRCSEATVRTTPQDFNRLFPGTGGALYGPASHGWMASFRRPGSRTQIPGLYLAGGSAHPGPGVPMAAISGRLAAAAILEDLTST